MTDLDIQESTFYKHKIRKTDNKNKWRKMLKSERRSYTHTDELPFVISNCFINSNVISTDNNIKVIKTTKNRYVMRI